MKFGGVAATITGGHGNGEIDVRTPAHAAGAVDVLVTASGGSTTATNGFTYVNVPTVTGVSPSVGLLAGGTSVAITGTTLTGASAVRFGATAATIFTVNSSTSITATAPAHAVGVTHVTVTTAGGTSSATANDQFTFGNGPAVTGVSPRRGLVAGGTSVTVTGTTLTGATAVMFGAFAAPAFTVNSATSITATSPAQAAGVVDVTVTTPFGTSSLISGDDFTFGNAPTLSAVSPNLGGVAGGTTVTIAGTDLDGASAVMFGSTAATSFTVDSGTSITATSPVHGPGVVDVTVTTPFGTSSVGAGDEFTFGNAPTVSGVSPDLGVVAGGTSVTIAGTDLDGASAVMFGSTAATSFTVDSGTSITATSPVHGPGVVDITVTTPFGVSSVGAGDEFTFGNAPTVSGVSPDLGVVAGGTSVTITGSDLDGATAVMFGSTAATNFTVDSSTSITATSPAHAAGPVDITVVTPFATSGTGSADIFTYGDVPVVTAISQNRGADAGGTTVTITGSDFTGAVAVLFGSTAATSFTVDSNTSITATSPPHAIGAVDITVVSPFGTSSGSTADEFTYSGPESPPHSSACCRMVTGDGGVFAAGSAQLYGGLQGQHLGAPVVGVASTPSGNGYWFVSSDGGVFAFGDASFFGSLGGRDLHAPIVAMAATPDGGGYWLAAADGGVFAFGDARLAGSMSGRHLNAPIVGITAPATGYLLVAADGGVFAFGGAHFFGSMGGARASAPVVGIAATSEGYLLVGFDGGVFAFGDAPMFGSMSGRTKGRAFIGIAAAGNGYLLMARDGVRFSFTTSDHAVESATPVDAPIVGIG